MNLKICLSPPEISLLQSLLFLFYLFYQYGISPCCSFFTADYLNLSWGKGINNVCNFRTEIIYKITDRDPGEDRRGRESLNNSLLSSVIVQFVLL